MVKTGQSMDPDVTLVIASCDLTARIFFLAAVSIFYSY